MSFVKINLGSIWGPYAEPHKIMAGHGDLLAGITIHALNSTDTDSREVSLVNVLLSRRGDVIVDFLDIIAQTSDQVLKQIREAQMELGTVWKNHVNNQRKNQKHITKLGCSAKLEIPRSAVEQINDYLNADNEDEYQGEDDTIIYTVRFPDGKEMDIKCCGCQDDASWTEAVLFDTHGHALCCTEPSDEYLGTWSLEHDGIKYAATVTEAKNEDINDADGEASILTKQEQEKFRLLFSKYCRQEINRGHCEEDSCDMCPVDRAYDEIFHTYELDKFNDEFDDGNEE